MIGSTNGLQHPLVHLVDGSRAVDDGEAVGRDLGDLLVGLGDGALQLQALGLEAVLALGAPQPELGIDPEEHGQVGPEPLGGGVGERDHLANPSPRAAP